MTAHPDYSLVAQVIIHAVGLFERGLVVGFVVGLVVGFVGCIERLK